MSWAVRQRRQPLALTAASSAGTAHSKPCCVELARMADGHGDTACTLAEQLDRELRRKSGRLPPAVLGSRLLQFVLNRRANATAVACGHSRRFKAPDRPNASPQRCEARNGQVVRTSDFVP